MVPPPAHEHSSRCWWDHEIAAWVCATVEADVDIVVAAQVVRAPSRSRG